MKSFNYDNSFNESFEIVCGEQGFSHIPENKSFKSGRWQENGEGFKVGISFAFDSGFLVSVREAETDIEIKRFFSTRPILSSWTKETGWNALDISQELHDIFSASQD